MKTLEGRPQDIVPTFQDKYVGLLKVRRSPAVAEWAAECVAGVAWGRGLGADVAWAGGWHGEGGWGGVGG